MTKPDYPRVEFATSPFTATADQWDGDLGPTWVTFDHKVPGWLGVSYDLPNPAPGLAAFITAAAAFGRARTLDYGSERFDFAAVYATRHPLGGTGGDLHYDGGRFDPTRRITRVVASWASARTAEVSNAFLCDAEHPAAAVLEGRPVTHQLIEQVLTQPANGQLAAFEEGLHLHGRPPVPETPGFGVFCSMALYRHGDQPDLHCPRLAALRDRGPYATAARGYVTHRANY